MKRKDHYQISPEKSLVNFSARSIDLVNKFALILKFHGVVLLLAYFKQSRGIFTSSLKLYDRVRLLVNLLAKSG